MAPAFLLHLIKKKFLANVNGRQAPKLNSGKRARTKARCMQLELCNIPRERKKNT